MMRVAAVLRRRARQIALLGTRGYAPEIQHRLMILNMIAYLIAVSTFGYAIQHSALDFERHRPVVMINLALLVTALMVPLAHRLNEIAGGLLLVGAEYIALMAFTVYLGHTSGIHLQYFVAAAAPFVVFGLERIRLVLAIVLAGLVLNLIAWFHFPKHKALIDADPAVLDSIYTQAAITTVALIAASIWYAFRLAAQARAETDALLRNILPDSIVERLKLRPGELVADAFEDASVLFADISGFVPLARRLGPERVVALLNDIVREFDGLAARHGVEKIKTIGDAYMVVGGLPQPAADHAERLAAMGLDMLAAIAAARKRTGLDLKVRIGMACGPVMAGVIGTKKFSYDVWGDTVNLAARLESFGIPGRMHVCVASREKLAGHCVFESHGTIEIKGVGQRESWYLTGFLASKSEARRAAESAPP